MPSLPIILAHGYLGFGTLGPLSYFNNVANILAQLGAKDIYATDLAAITRYELRGMALWPFAAPAQVHFAAGQLRDAVQGIATGDYSHFATYFSGLFSLDDAALGDLTTENCARLFRDDEQDLKGVPAFSYAGSIEPAAVSPLLGTPAILLDAMGEPNDGLVPVSSATLKRHGVNLPVDHLGLIGWGATDVSACYRGIYASLA